MIDDASSSDEEFVKATRAKRASFFEGVAPENRLTFAWNNLEPGYFSPREEAALSSPADRPELFDKRSCANEKHHQCQHCASRDIFGWLPFFYCNNDDCEYEEVGTYHWAETDETCEQYYYWTSP